MRLFRHRFRSLSTAGAFPFASYRTALPFYLRARGPHAHRPRWTRHEVAAAIPAASGARSPRRRPPAGPHPPRDPRVPSCSSRSRVANGSPGHATATPHTLTDRLYLHRLSVHLRLSPSEPLATPSRSIASLFPSHANRHLGVFPCSLLAYRGYRLFRCSASCSSWAYGIPLLSAYEFPHHAQWHPSPCFEP